MEEINLATDNLIRKGEQLMRLYDAPPRPIAAPIPGFYGSRFARHHEDIRNALDLAIRSNNGETSDHAAGLALHLTHALVDMIHAEFPALSE